MYHLEHCGAHGEFPQSEYPSASVLASHGFWHLSTVRKRSMTSYRLPTSVCVFLFREQEDGREYLLLSRRATNLGAFWQGVTGALEDGEKLLQGAAREVFEETGLTPTKIYCVDFTYSFPVKDEWREAYGPDPHEIVEHVFVAEVDGSDPTLSKEHDDWGWHIPEKAASILKWPDNIEALWRCEAFLREERGKSRIPQQD